MFLLSAEAYTSLRMQVRNLGSSFAGGLLGGEKQGGITRVLPVAVCPFTANREWQLDPHEFTTTMTRLLQEGYSLQGIYLINAEPLSAPTPTLIQSWRYNVPCFLVSSTPSGTLYIGAFAIDPLLQQASPIPVWIDQPPDEQGVPTAPGPGTCLGRDVQTGKAVWLSDEARHLSSYCIGGMGMGKTTLLLNLIVDDIARGDGLCVLDPHGDLTQDILVRIPPHREQDVILWDLSDMVYPFGLNLFECADTTDAKLVDQVSSQAISTFYKLFYDSWGPRMEQILRAATLTLIANQDLPKAQRPTLAELPALLLDDAYRAFLVSRLTNHRVQSYWRQRYNTLRKDRRDEYIEPVLNKVNRFLHNDTTYYIVAQAESSLNLRQIMDEGKILLVNLSKGELGEDTSSLLGSVLVGKLLTAALARSVMPVAQRQPFHLVVDEYQNFATQTFLTLQTEARKYGIDTMVAHQTRALLDPASKGATTAVGNLLCFRVSGEDAKELATFFDNTPPEPAVVGVQPVRTYSTSPWEHLIRHGHSNPRVNQLVLQLKEALTIIPTRELPNFHAPYFVDPNPMEMLKRRSGNRLPIADVRRFITEEDARSFGSLLNSYLSKRMRGLADSETMDEAGRLQALGPFYTTFRYYREPGYCTVAVGKGEDEFLVYDPEASHQLQREQLRQQMEFYEALEALAVLLAEAPIWADSGQLQEVKDKPRLYSDVAAETANTLAALHPYQALCRIIGSDGKRSQCLIKTYPAAPIVEGAAERSARIRTRSRETYGRAHTQLEHEMGERTSIREKARPAGRARPARAATPTTDQAQGASTAASQTSLWEPVEPS